MTTDGFAEALSRLVSEAEDAGLDRPAMIEVLDELTETLRVSEAE